MTRCVIVTEDAAGRLVLMLCKDRRRGRTVMRAWDVTARAEAGTGREDMRSAWRGIVDLPEIDTSLSGSVIAEMVDAREPGAINKLSLDPRVMRRAGRAYFANVLAAASSGNTLESFEPGQSGYTIHPERGLSFQVVPGNYQGEPAVAIFPGDSEPALLSHDTARHLAALLHALSHPEEYARNEQAVYRITPEHGPSFKVESGYFGAEPAVGISLADSGRALLSRDNADFLSGVLWSLSHPDDG